MRPGAQNMCDGLQDTNDSNTLFQIARWFGQQCFGSVLCKVLGAYRGRTGSSTFEPLRSVMVQAFLGMLERLTAPAGVKAPTNTQKEFAPGMPLIRPQVASASNSCVYGQKRVLQIRTEMVPL